MSETSLKITPAAERALIFPYPAIPVSLGRKQIANLHGRNLETDLETLRRVLGLAQKRDFAAAGALPSAPRDGFEIPMLLNISATRLEQEGKYERH